jgi:hypothetical protein
MEQHPPLFGPEELEETPLTPLFNPAEMVIHPAPASVPPVESEVQGEREYALYQKFLMSTGDPQHAELAVKYKKMVGANPSSDFTKNDLSRITLTPENAKSEFDRLEATEREEHAQELLEQSKGWRR